MCRIASVDKIGGKSIIGCEGYEGAEFMNAHKIEITNSSGKLFSTDRFILDKTKPCFSNGGQPWIMLTDNVPDSFLNRGNEVRFI